MKNWVAPLKSGTIQELNLMVSQLNYALNGIYQTPNSQLISTPSSSSNPDFEKVFGQYETATSLLIDNLDGQAHDGYDFDFWIFNTTGASVTYYLYANNDQTQNNYTSYGSWFGATTSNLAPVAGSYLGSVLGGGIGRMTGSIGLSPRLDFYANVFNNRSEGLVELYGMHRTAPLSSNLTRLDIVATAALGIGGNSIIRLWGKK